MSRFLILVLFAFPSVAFANAGLPMLAVVWPISVFAFIPVVAIESWVVHRALNISWSVSITQMVKGNIFSTIVGIPVAWVLAVVVEFLIAFLVTSATGSESYPPQGFSKFGLVILSAPWLPPFTEGTHWIIPLATMVLLVPFFFASFWAEAWYISGDLYPESPQRARRAVWRANAYSYIGLFVATVCWLVFGLVTHA